MKYKVGQDMEVLNATNPAYHLKGDILTIICIEDTRIKVHDDSGGAVWYSAKDVLPIGDNL